MFKSILLASIILSSTCHAVSDVVCYNPQIVDTAFVATFKNVYRKKGVSVTLAVPVNETTVKSFKGPCKTDKGVSHYRIRCDVKGDRADLYVVTMSSVGGKRLVATATQLGVDENPYPLPICK